MSEPQMASDIIGIAFSSEEFPVENLFLSAIALNNVGLYNIY